MSKRDLSLYFHIPFCKRRCSYCTFYHVPHIRDYEDVFVDSIVAETQHAIAEIGAPVSLKTVYFGGGTPSVLKTTSLDRLFDTFESLLDANAEITFEINPEDVTTALLNYIAGRGVNRVSVGVQSMVPHAQRVLKRCSPEQNARCLELVGRSFENFSVDVLLGVPDAHADDVRQTLSVTCGTNPAHFSVYCLEPGGVMQRDVGTFFDRVDSEQAGDEYLYVCETLREAGYAHYEVSNFARDGFESQHNFVYWSGGEYLGLGPGAHSYTGGTRFFNEPSIEKYIQNPIGAARRQVEPRTQADCDLEALMLGLRTSRGVARQKLACEPVVLNDIVDSGWAVLDGDRVTLTDPGYLLLDEIILRVSQAA